MERENETLDVIEIGSVTAETKGGEVLGVDEQGLRIKAGLSDD